MPVCCSVLQCVAVCCSVLQCVAVCCSVLQLWISMTRLMMPVCCSVLQCVAVCCSVLQCVAVCCSVLQLWISMTRLMTPVRCSVLQCVAEFCNVLQCDRMYHCLLIRVSVVLFILRPELFVFARFDSFICAIWLIHMYDMTHSHVWCESFSEWRAARPYESCKNI